MKEQILETLNMSLDLEQNPNLLKLIERSPMDFNVLHRIPYHLLDSENLELYPLEGQAIPVVFLDVETTGLEHNKDKIIELGLVKVLVDSESFRIHKIIEAVSIFHDPGITISDKITTITGVTNEMIAGAKLIYQDVARFFNDDPIVVAHNARFDRPFIDDHFPELANLRWACSLQEIKWRDHGFSAQSLESLMMSQGWFYSAHRATIDCFAMLWCFMLNPTYLGEMLYNSTIEDYVLFAHNAPFAVKDTLKEAGYRWNADRKLWYIKGHSNNIESLVSQLCNIYDARTSAEYIKYTNRQRYKS